MSGPHVLVELVGLVHFVCLRLFSVQPPLQQFRIILNERLITLFNLTQF